MAQAPEEHRTLSEGGQSHSVMDDAQTPFQHLTLLPLHVVELHLDCVSTQVWVSLHRIGVVGGHVHLRRSETQTSFQHLTSPSLQFWLQAAWLAAQRPVALHLTIGLGHGHVEAEAAQDLSEGHRTGNSSGHSDDDEEQSPLDMTHRPSSQRTSFGGGHGH